MTIPVTTNTVIPRRWESMPPAEGVSSGEDGSTLPTAALENGSCLVQALREKAMNWSAGSYPINQELQNAAEIRFSDMNVPEPTQVTFHVRSSASGDGVAHTQAKLYVFFRRNGVRCQITKDGRIVEDPPLPLHPSADDMHYGGIHLTTELAILDPDKAIIFRPGDSDLVARVIYSQGADVNLDFIKMTISSYGPAPD